MNNSFSRMLIRGALSSLLVCAAWLSPAAVQTASATEYCFGASGQGCGGWTFGEMPRFAFCSPAGSNGVAKCAVSGGSMTHDPCCVRSPRGKVCGGRPETAQCTVEWNRAVDRAKWGYQWLRNIDTRRGNDTGVVERPLYCAQRGSGVHRNDESFCCSRSARDANSLERFARPDLKICL